MNCGEFQSRLAAWLAGDTDETEARALEAHMYGCASCQALVEPPAEEDDQLRTKLADPAAAERVAQRAIAQIAVAAAAPVSADSSLNLRQWFVPLLSAAAGFLLAMAIFSRPNPGPKPNVPPVAPQPPPTVAHLVTATGLVERFDEAKKDWVAIDQTKHFGCPTDSRVRTAPNVRCELQTGDGCVIRLNDQTEVTLLGTSSIELRQGQVWCRSPQEAALEIRLASTDKTLSKEPKAAPPTLWGAGSTCLVTGNDKSGQMQVVSAEGEVNLRTAAGDERLGPGQVVEISDGQVIKPTQRVDPLLATRWMQPLIINRGGDNRELQQRVDTLLAQIGRAKITTMYEQEIRSLGEHGVLPLIRFIQSPLAENGPARKHAAMRLTADLAPIWLIPDLIDLLEDRDSYVRQSAAATLLRLTGMDMGQPPQSWREELDDAHKTTVMDWRNWWATHQHQYPSPKLQITKEATP